MTLAGAIWTFIFADLIMATLVGIWRSDMGVPAEENTFKSALGIATCIIIVITCIVVLTAIADQVRIY